MDRFTARLGWLWIRRSHTVVSCIDVWSQSVIFLLDISINVGFWIGGFGFIELALSTQVIN